MPPYGDVTPMPQSATVVDRQDERGLTMRLYDRDDWSVIEVSGELDIQGVPLLRQLLLRAGHQFVFDLTRVTFVDCGGLRILVGPVSDGSSPTRRLVSAEHGKVRRLLKVTGWEPRVRLFESVGEAVRAPA